MAFRALRWLVSKSLRYHGATSFAWVSPFGIVPQAYQMIIPYVQFASRIRDSGLYVHDLVFEF
jgi:hypothetical protein